MKRRAQSGGAGALGACALTCVLGLSCGEREKAKAPEPAPAASVSRATYELAYDGKTQRLEVVARFPPGTPSSFAVEPGSEPWLEDVRFAKGERFEAVPSGPEVRVPCDAGCTLRYGYALGASGRERRDIDTARTEGVYVESPPSTWLLAPVGGSDDAALAFRVQASDGYAFVSGFPEQDGYRATTVGLLRTAAPYSSFGPYELRTRVTEDVTFTVAMPRERRRPDDALFDEWITKSAGAVRGVLGRFPASHAALIVSLDPGDDVEVGFSMGGSSILLRVGERTDRATFLRDWVLTHEMLHFACPSQPDARDWAEEGLATYVEPFARARAGLVSREDAWKGLVRGFAYGQPQAGDRGLDRTRTWGRMYWGGALFFFEADYAIRLKTQGKKTLFDAIAAIVAAGGTNASGWTLEHAFEIGDAATGTHVLVELLARHGSGPEPFDYLTHLADLGVSRVGGHVVFDPKAPHASLVERW